MLHVSFSLFVPFLYATRPPSNQADCLILSNYYLSRNEPFAFRSEVLLHLIVDLRNYHPLVAHDLPFYDGVLGFQNLLSEASSTSINSLGLQVLVSQSSTHLNSNLPYARVSR